MPDAEVEAFIEEFRRDLNLPKDYMPDPGVLHKGEAFWRDRQPWLRERGYELRARYQPDWKPSWQVNGLRPKDCEDGLQNKRTYLVDAVRVEDQSTVILKRLTRKYSPYEVEIGQYLSSGSLRADPRNHCVPFIDVLEVPEDEATVIIVMPFLRPFDDPPFSTVGEVMECLGQLLEGLAFMHEHGVAHRDCSGINFMMDATSLFPIPTHPVATNKSRDLSRVVRPYPRSERPPQYYLIDFGISLRFQQDALPALVKPVFGADKSVPEYRKKKEPSDPFATDVYLAGNLIRQHFLQKYKNLTFLDGLVSSMVLDDPTQRPKIGEVTTTFEKVRRAHGTKSDYRLVKQSELIVETVARDIHHSVRGLFRRSAPRQKSTAKSPK